MVKRKGKLWCKLEKITRVHKGLFGKIYSVKLFGIDKEISVPWQFVSEDARQSYDDGKPVCSKTAKAYVNRGV